MARAEWELTNASIYIVCDFRVIFDAKDGEFAYLVQGGEDAVFVKSKEDNQSRKERR